MFSNYTTINNVTGKIYCGVHDESLAGEYLGSGTCLKRAVKKYGKQAFTRVVDRLWKDQDAAYLAESMIVDAEFIARQDTYNIFLGGSGGDGGDIVRGKISASLNALYATEEGKASAKSRGRKLSTTLKSRTDQELKVVGDRIRSRLAGRTSVEKEDQILKFKATMAKKTSEELALRNRRIGEGNKDKKHAPRSQECRDRIAFHSLGRVHLAETKEKMSVAKREFLSTDKGKATHKKQIERRNEFYATDEGKVVLAERGLRYKKSVSENKIICPHCDRSIGAPNYARWHGDNCKRRK